MRILLAPNAFKGSLGAREVAELAGAQLASQFPGSRFITVPIADGGDGTVEVLLAVGFLQVSASTVDALMRANSSRMAVQGSTAVIELAEICGLAGVQDLAPRPWDTSSFGVGLAAHAALAQGAKHLLIALGGSASIDGGLGLLAGLGYQLLDANGDEVPPTASGLMRVSSIGPSVNQTLIDGCTWTLLVDVESPATGPSGAAHVFGPQKGLTEAECYQVDAAMREWCRVVAHHSGRFTVGELEQLPGAGAAGGFAVAASGVIGAQIESGAEAIARLTDLSSAVEDAEAVVIGEGRLDEQTLAGKGPAFVASIAKAAGKPVYALAGSSTLTAEQCASLGIRAESDVVTLVEVAGSLEAALGDPRTWLGKAVEVLGDRLQASGL
ncbi:MAG: glycerate kinase [Actinobacteria bacterium]|nr:glycerate kinase [Actinomycetota bacterium]